VLPSVVGVAIARSMLAVTGYYALKKHQSFVLANDQAKQYVEQTVMVAKLKSELFYLEKSSQDIENVMEKAYWLYKELHAKVEDSEPNSPLLADQALAVAREIHEIKKDYYRVITGIENILSPSDEGQKMKLSDILFVIEQNTIRYLEVINKKVNITYEHSEDFVTDKQYTLVSILDNLIINAIEACDDGGVIRVVQTVLEENIYFCIEDNGVGIAEDEMELIFNPAYSTKFSPHTGKMSTGLGLSHVQDYITLFGGTIDVESRSGEGAQFLVMLPRERVVITSVKSE